MNRTIRCPIVRLSGSLGCSPILVLPTLYLNLTPDSFDSFWNRTSASNLTILFLESDTCGGFAREICSVLIQVRFKSCARFFQISPIRLKSTIVRFGFLPDCQNQKYCPIQAQNPILTNCQNQCVRIRFMTFVRFVLCVPDSVH